MPANDLSSLAYLRSATSPAGVPAFDVGIVIGPGFVPMDMVGVHTVFGLMPGARIHLLWKTTDLVEGFPSWWTKPTSTFSDCPEKLDVLAIPMLAPEVQNDPEVIEFVREKSQTASYLIGICNGILVFGAAGVLKGRRVTASLNALPIPGQAWRWRSGARWQGHSGRWQPLHRGSRYRNFRGLPSGR